MSGTRCIVECTGTLSRVSKLQQNATMVSLSAPDCRDLTGLIGSCNCSVSVEQLSCIRSMCSSSELDSFKFSEAMRQGQATSSVSAFPTSTGTSASSATHAIVAPFSGTAVSSYSSSSTIVISSSSGPATQIPGAAISSLNTSHHISATLSAALSALLTLLFSAVVLLFLRWRKRYIMSRAHTRASPLSLVERHRADTGDAQVLDMCAARPFVRLADDSAAPSMYRSSSESILNTPWRMSQQHPTITREYSVHACDGSAHSYSDILPAVPAKPAPARIGKARRARSSTAPSSYQSGMDTAYSRAPRSLSFQYPPPPPPKIWRQSSSSLALVPPSPDTAERPRQSASRASADEGFIMLPWPGLGEHLLALLATTRTPGQRPDSASVGSSEGLPEYASQE